MSPLTSIPELLAPAGSLDAVRAAIANGADSIYLGAGRFNARDEGAQLTVAELEAACRMAHARQKRIYLTLNTLIKSEELEEALTFLSLAVAAGIDAVIVQDLGLIGLIRELFPALEIHGSTQMTVHDPSAAAVLRDIGVERIVLARENSLEDIDAIRNAVPGIGLESFIHGALCISYSGQCFMSGMISERSANRGSCAQSCRKGYQLVDIRSGETLDEGFVISARDLAALEHVENASAAGIVCFKIEGRKKKPEYVATVTAAYRRVLDRLGSGENAAIAESEMTPLIQIFSRGFTSGLYGGRDGRDYVTRTQPDNVGAIIGEVVEQRVDGIVIDVSDPVAINDGLGFDAPDMDAPSRGFRVRTVTTFPGASKRGLLQFVETRESIPVGWRVARSSQAELLERARSSYESRGIEATAKRTRVDATVAGNDGEPLQLTMSAGEIAVHVIGTLPLARAIQRPTDVALLRQQLGRLGETAFVLGGVDVSGLGENLFVPMSELNHLRQRAVEELVFLQRDRVEHEEATFRERVRTALAGTGDRNPQAEEVDSGLRLSVEVHTVEDARAAAAAGATEIVFDPFLRHPVPPASRVRALADELHTAGKTLRLRTPTIVRPQDRQALEKWIALELPILTGHLGLLAEFGASGRDVTGDYALNCFNEHTAARLFDLGARGLVLSIELTIGEIAQLVAPWRGSRFSALAYGRPEGMTIEHCVLSAAFDREPTTCRDLCVQKHPEVELIDPAGYSFPVATDSDCRNRLLHSRPIDASAFMPRLWEMGIREFKLLMNIPSLPVADIVASYRGILEALQQDRKPSFAGPKALFDGKYTRGHYTRAV